MNNMMQGQLMYEATSMRLHDDVCCSIMGMDSMMMKADEMVVHDKV